MNKKQLREFVKGNLNLFGFKRGKIKRFRFLGMGESNFNYYLKINSKEFVLRLSINKTQKLRKEYDNLLKLKNQKIAPKPVFYHEANKDFPYDFLVYEYLPGKSLNKKIADEYVLKLAKVIAKLHNNVIENKVNSYQETFKWAEIFVKLLKKYNKKIKGKLNFILNEFKKIIPQDLTLKSLVHGDLAPENIILSENKLKIIDLESMEYANPAKDIACIFINFNLTNKQKKIFLQEYLKRRKQNNVGNIFIFMNLILLDYFLWSLVRAYEIKNRALNKIYLNKNDPLTFVKHAKRIFLKIKRLNSKV